MNVREWALPVYTILMQLAVGALLILWLTRALMKAEFKHSQADQMIRNPILVIAFTVMVSMLGSHFHLSKPWLSFLAVSNFRTSWLSREIIFTVLFYITICSLWFTNRYAKHNRTTQALLGWAAVGSGLALIYCMGRIYMLPSQVAWNTPNVILSFFITGVLLGVMTVVCLLILDLRYAVVQQNEDIPFRRLVIRKAFPIYLIVTIMLVFLNFFVSFQQITQLQGGDITMQTSLELLFELYFPLLILRLILLVSAPLLFGIYTYHLVRGVLVPEVNMTLIIIACLLTLIAEIIGRFLFYATHIRLGI